MCSQRWKRPRCALGPLLYWHIESKRTWLHYTIGIMFWKCQRYVTRILLIFFFFFFCFSESRTENEDAAKSENIYLRTCRIQLACSPSFCELSFRSVVCNKSSVPAGDKLVHYNTETRLPFKILVKMRLYLSAYIKVFNTLNQ